MNATGEKFPYPKDPHDPDNFYRPESYSEEELRSRLKEYAKFMFVRHPMERLVSAYRDKFVNNNRSQEKWFFSRYGRKIIKRYRANATRESFAKGHDVTFAEFVQYVIDLPRSNHHIMFDNHWRPMHDLCFPCAIQYDGKIYSKNELFAMFKN